MGGKKGFYYHVVIDNYSHYPEVAIVPNKIMELDDRNDYELNTNLVVASARVTAENMVINKSMENDLENQVPGLQWELHSPPQMQEVINPDDGPNMNVDPTIIDPEMVDDNDSNVELNDMTQVEV